MIFQHSRFVSRSNTFTGREQRQSGFTLIELLVVIAIIALLAAILFPVFARARENARKSSCANNLKQIGIGIAQYTQDFDESFPIQTSNSAAPAQGATFVTLLQPYVKNSQIFICPSASRKVATSSMSDSTDYLWQAPKPPWNASSQGSYGVNNNVVLSVGPAFTLSDIAHPTITALAFDCAWYSGSNVLDGNVQGAQRHFDGINYVFLDTHVKWQKVKGTNGASPNFNPYL